MKQVNYSQKTTKSVPEIRGIVRGLFNNAVVNNVELTAIDEPADIAVYIDAKPGLFGGRGLVDLRVVDKGSFRQIEAAALATSFSDNVAMGFDQDVSGLREIGTSKKMVRTILDAIG